MRRESCTAPALAAFGEGSLGEEGYIVLWQVV